MAGNPFNGLVDAYSNAKPAVVSTNTLFNLKDLFQSIHGYVPTKLPGLAEGVEFPELPNIPANSEKRENLYGQPLYGSTDTLGYEVFCPITIEVNGKDYYFPFVCVGIRRSKTVVFTDMTELDSSVKEIISNRDYDISIRGFVIGELEQFPDEKLKMLAEVQEYKGVVRLKSAYTDIFLHDNDNVLILDLDIPPKPKVIGVRDFSFAAVSDGIFTLYQS